MVEDIRAMFPDDKFSNFRNLIVQNGKNQDGNKLAKISPEVLATAFDGIKLTDDENALKEIVVNTINSKDVHMVEYQNDNGVLKKPFYRVT